MAASTSTTGRRNTTMPSFLNACEFATNRALELSALTQVLKRKPDLKGAGGTGDEVGKYALAMARHLRRRTTSYLRRRISFRSAKKRKKRVKLGSLKGGETGQGERTSAFADAKEDRLGTDLGSVDGTQPSRSVRRREEFRKIRDGRGSFTKDGYRRLETHVWHAKRFSMCRKWGYCLPEGLPGRGRGSRSILRWVSQSAILHDSSYHNPIKLIGNESELHEILCLLSHPHSYSCINEELMHKVKLGVRAINILLYEAEKFPLRFICPTLLMWRPVSNSDSNTIVNPRERESSFPSDPNQLRNKEHSQTKNLHSLSNNFPERRELWLWVHASAYQHTLQAINSATEILIRRKGRLDMTIEPKIGEISFVELVGKTANDVLNKVFSPLNREHSKTEEQSMSWNLLKNPNMLPNGAILAIQTCDPRASPFKMNKWNEMTLKLQKKIEIANQATVPATTMNSNFVAPDTTPSTPISASDGKDSHSSFTSLLVEQEIRITSSSFEHTKTESNDVALQTKQVSLHDHSIHSNKSEAEIDTILPRSVDCDSFNEEKVHEFLGQDWSDIVWNGKNQLVSDSPLLWNTPRSSTEGERFERPLSQFELTQQIRQSRLAAFIMISKRNNAMFNQIPLENSVQSPIDSLVDPSIDFLNRLAEKGKLECPVLLVRRIGKSNSETGWILIFPSCWMQCFWTSLVLGGGHVVGLRERRWINIHSGIPSFPFDYFDSCSFYSNMANEIKTLQLEYDRRPASKRNQFPPSSPLWTKHLLTKLQKETKFNNEIEVDSILQNPLESNDYEKRFVFLRENVCVARSFQDFKNFVSFGRLLASNFPSKGSKHLRNAIKRNENYFSSKTTFELLERKSLVWKPVGAKGKDKNGEKGNEQARAIEGPVGFVHVRLTLPRKGFIDENAIIYIPMKEDFEKFCSRKGLIWQGVEILSPRIFAQQSLGRVILERTFESRFCGNSSESSNSSTMEIEGKKNKFFQEINAQKKNYFDVELENDFREPIGFITAGQVKGSKIALGYCLINDLNGLRSKQYSNYYSNQSSVFALVRNPSSTMMRPALVSFTFHT